jgi:phosphotransferase system enzyme I (PtsI)
MFKVQLRAILKASHYGNVKLLFPLITCLSELNKAKEITYDVMNDLKKEGIPFNESIPIGIMIEVPSAALKADILAAHCDFFSVGTNDLIQYMSAADRVNEKLAYLYNPIDVSILRVLKTVREAARAANIPVSICGEMAAQSEYTSLLLGLGYTDLSMSLIYMHQVKQIIRNISMKESVDFANEILQCTDNHTIQKKLKERHLKKIPEIQ